MADGTYINNDTHDKQKHRKTKNSLPKIKGRKRRLR